MYVISIVASFRDSVLKHNLKNEQKIKNQMLIISAIYVFIKIIT